MSKKLAGRMKIGMTGRYKFIVRNPDLTVKEETEWGKNVITQVGLDYLLGKDSGSSESMFLHCVVGSGNSPPDIGDTTLDNYLGVFSAVHNLSIDRKYNEPPYHHRYTTTHRFWPGSLGSNPVNISEAGMVFTNLATSTINSSSQVCSRGLVVDALGNPAVVPYDAANEYLDVVWEWTWLVPSEVSGVVNLDIHGVPTSHDFAVRPSRMDGSISPSASYGWGSEAQYIQGSEPSTRGSVGLRRFWPQIIVGAGNSRLSSWASDGGLQAADQEISGVYSSSLLPNAFNFENYTNGSNFRDMELTWSLTNGNVGGAGISAVNVVMHFSGWQVSYDPPIPKTSSDQLSLTFRVEIENA